MSTINHPASAASMAVDETPAFIKAFKSAKDLFREPHPFARKSTYLKPHPVAWEKYTRQFRRAAMFYIPAAVLVFGWPFALKWTINYSNGVYDKPTKMERQRAKAAATA